MHCICCGRLHCMINKNEVYSVFASFFLPPDKILYISPTPYQISMLEIQYCSVCYLPRRPSQSIHITQSGNGHFLAYIPPQGGWGGARPHPLSLYLPSRTKLWCTIQLREGRYTPPISPLPLYDTLWRPFYVKKIDVHRPGSIFH
jgi:hypothetical protein